MQVIPRLILNPTTKPLTVLTHWTARPRLFIPSIHLRSPTPRFGRIWCSGQAWIRILDLVRYQLEHTIDLTLLCHRPYRGCTRRCCMHELGRWECIAAILPRCMLELGTQIQRNWLVTSSISAFDTFPLIREAPPSTPCLACMLSRPKAYFATANCETCIRSSLDKDRL